MKKILKDLQVLRTAPLYTDRFQNSNVSCAVRHTGRGTHVIFTIYHCSIFITQKNIQFYSYFKDEEFHSFKVPYKCEDQNEFFQLSTLHDYHGMTFDDLIQIHKLCDFMIKRDINERKR